MKDGSVRGAGGRFGEIVAILSRHHIVKGLTPEGLRQLLEELGPTYMKLGQILSTRPDVLPEPYCLELAKLRSDAAPMPIETVRAAIEAEFSKPWDEVFRSMDPEPLGAASIAQAHLAELPDGRKVVAKVQRPGIHETMARDVALLRKAAGLIKFTPVGGTVDFSLVLDELWKAAQHEMNFLEEAENLREFARLNAGVPYVACPEVVDDLVTARVLVLEYVDGIPIDDREALMKAGCDLHDLAEKLSENFIKQVLDDRFFHADPHPGNLRVRDCRIVWLDLGMMGRLNGADGMMFSRYVEAVAMGDAEAVTDAVLAMGVCKEPPDRARLTSDIDVLLSRYRQMPLSAINVGGVMQEFLALARRHGIAMPASLTMLARSVVILESVLTRLDPETNLLQIMSTHMKKDELGPEHLRRRLEKVLTQLYGSSEKLSAIPSQVSDALAKLLSGRATLTVKVAGQEQEARAKDRRSQRLSLAVIAAGLSVGAGLVSLSGLPGPGGLPWLGWVFLAGAAAALIGFLSRGRR